MTKTKPTKNSPSIHPAWFQNSIRLSGLIRYLNTRIEKLEKASEKLKRRIPKTKDFQ